MRHSIALVSVLAGAVMAADTTIDFLFPGRSEGKDPVATIKSVNPTTTAMHVACPSGTDSNDCGWGPDGLDYTIISKTHYQGVLSEVMSYGCDYNSAKSDMTCVVAMSAGAMSMSGETDTDMADVGPVTATSVLKSGQFALIHATVVSGANLLPGTTSGAISKSTPVSAAAAAAASSGLKTDVIVSATGSAASSMKSAASSHASQSGSAAPAQATGAAARYGIQGSALVALVGAAAAGLF